MTFTVVLAALLAAAGARADELTADAKAVRRASNITVEDLRVNAQAHGAASASVSPSSGTPPTVEGLMDSLRRTSEDLLEPMKQLERLKSRYAKLSDLSPIDGERNALRRVLLEAQSRFNEQFQFFVALKKEQETMDLEEIFAGGLRNVRPDKLGVAIGRFHFGEDMHDFRLKLRSIIQEDEEAYESRVKAIEEERARKRAWLRGGAAGVFVLAAAGLWAWRRKRAPSATAAPGAGSVVGGNYRLEREIGRGGMGLVFEATDIALRRKVAVKQLRPELRQSPKDLEMFLAEARLVAALRHPHIVEIYAIVTEGSDLHLVFELVTGQPLHLALQRVGRLKLDTAAALIKQVGSALDFAHANRVIHRDLKPANVMLTPQGSAKVMDFGLAHQASMTVAKLTHAESWGTPPYMAPEQELGTVSRESDLYALGVMLYESVTGNIPFPGPNFLAQKREMRFAPPSQVAPGLPAGLDDVVRRALEADPARRFHSAAEMVEALGPWATS